MWNLILFCSTHFHRGSVKAGNSSPFQGPIRVAQALRARRNDQPTLNKSKLSVSKFCYEL